MDGVIKNKEELSKLADELCEKLDEMQDLLEQVKRCHNKKHINDYIISDFIDVINHKMTIDDIKLKTRDRFLLSNYLRKILSANFKLNVTEMMMDPLVQNIIKNNSEIFLEEILCPIIKKHRLAELKELGFKFGQIAIEGNSAILGPNFIQSIEEQSLIMSWHNIDEIPIPVKWRCCQIVLTEAHEELNYEENDDIIALNMDNLSSYCNMQKLCGG